MAGLLLDDLIELILVESGQFIAPLEATLLDRDKILILAKKELHKYSKYRPLEGTTSVRLYNNKSFSVENDGIVPDRITKIRRRNVSEYIVSGTRSHGVVSTYYWEYTNPVLYFNLPDDTYEISYITEHSYNSDLEIFPTLNINEGEFINLILGKFLQAVGRSRRAFTLQDLPITTDAEELVSEGKEIYLEATESLRLSNKFWLSISI